MACLSLMSFIPFLSEQSLVPKGFPRNIFPLSFKLLNSVIVIHTFYSTIFMIPFLKKLRKLFEIQTKLTQKAIFALEKRITLPLSAFDKERPTLTLSQLAKVEAKGQF